MKKTIKLITCLTLALLLPLACVTSAFASGSYLTYAGYVFSVENGQANLHAYTGNENDLYIPDELWGYTVAGIDDNAFFGGSDYTALYLQYAKHLKTIGKFAFYGCSGFHNAVVPQEVETIGSGAFQSCTSLQRVTFNTEKVTVIEPQTFYQCSQLSEISLPSSVTELGDYAFAECSSLSYLELPTTVTTFGNDVFLGDSSLTLGVYFDSAAYHYAIDNGINYRLLDGALLGDADGDGSVNVSDVTKIQRYLAELETLEGIYLHAADANQDGTVDISDATALQMYIAEYDLPYPIGEVMTQ